MKIKKTELQKKSKKRDSAFSDNKENIVSEKIIDNRAEAVNQRKLSYSISSSTANKHLSPNSIVQLVDCHLYCNGSWVGGGSKTRSDSGKGYDKYNKFGKRNKESTSGNTTETYTHKSYTDDSCNHAERHAWANGKAKVISEISKLKSSIKKGSTKPSITIEFDVDGSICPDCMTWMERNVYSELNTACDGKVTFTLKATVNKTSHTISPGSTWPSGVGDRTQAL